MGETTSMIGATARQMADGVRKRELDAVELVRAHLDHAESIDTEIGAWQILRHEKALAEAKELLARDDLGDLPLAGVPIAIKDNVDVAGEPTRDGSAATPDAPKSSDHEVVKRIRSAGAVVIGKTRVPELCTFGTTDSVFGVTRNPWDPSRTTGGSSGGSAAAVASAMVPFAHGNDGMGSVRIPSACCGLFGIKPGTGVVPVGLGKNDWYGLAQNGALATSVDDAALLLDVMAGRSEFRDPQPPADPLRIALSTKSPALAGGVDSEFRKAVERVGALLEESGHTVDRCDPPYSVKVGPAAFLRWTGGVASDAEELDLRRLEARNRRHAAIGRIAEKRGWVGIAGRDRWRAALEPMFGRYDLLITPALARPPIEAEEWWKKSWLANLASNARFAPMAAPWNLADFPAASIPAGMHSAGTPLAIQLVAPLGGEGTILSLAKQIEELSPWPRHAPLAGVEST